MDAIYQTDRWPALSTQVFAVIGLLWLSTKIFSFWRLLASIFIIPGISLSKFGGKGTWALVTGASDGIGKEFALQLAAKGFNVVLVSRTESKLKTLATEIVNKYKVKALSYAMDFTADKDSDYHELTDMVKNLDISILINNVGLSHDIPVPFELTSEEEMKNIITVNCIGTLRTTRAILPGMIKRKGGLILTMASFGGLTPTPLLATYSGSKAFLQQWSSALSSELAPHRIKVQLELSYLVTSAMSKVKRPSLFVATPKQFVRSALSKIGRSGGAQGIAATCTPYWSHAIMHWAIATFAGFYNHLFVDFNKSIHEDVRKRALRKRERDAKKAS